MVTRLFIVGLIFVIRCQIAFGQHTYPIAEAWARTKVNAVIFRRNAICTHGDQQVAAFYDEQGRVVLAKRPLGSNQWVLSVTSLRGRTKDAHNCIDSQRIANKSVARDSVAPYPAGFGAC